MGLSIAKLFQDMFSTQMDVRILMVGLDAAGKTTILYKLKLGEVQNTVPTIGFNVEEVQYGSVTFNVWDCGGQEKIRKLWKHYYEGVRGVIFVIDSTDRDRVDEAKEEVFGLLNEPELKDAVFLILSNKKDLPKAMSTSELTERLGLLNLPKTRVWNVQNTCALDGEGLYEGLDWLTHTISES
mmetsp:Transcript_29234/g.40387  ORF Transcript_29234/g.40387 Transcript_29234/m.40387 type:complete len:183 (-) Transcript_29234:141-689(-)|eukprot:CAMPEP_0201490398 /NCGR_PEP_ID=MMETSP0151_2-20130828/26533_1 /ASSEMBLY_ACC=CAM_ASM_000257 /TAXON_ID=200890 /ORGANISM="Paramoeba atlantica, Strain 621/1 / CCAP 1560/9" /LENGTH=182 /DNA_ID=CAMNT_0047876361 /DNA_START=108 /DNA_END=656 /DNA_ORIENTATION=-